MIFALADRTEISLSVNSLRRCVEPPVQASCIASPIHLFDESTLSKHVTPPPFNVAQKSSSPLSRIAPSALGTPSSSRTPWAVLDLPER